jgi:hypothetical protein
LPGAAPGKAGRTEEVGAMENDDELYYKGRARRTGKEEKKEATFTESLAKLLKKGQLPRKSDVEVSSYSKYTGWDQWNELLTACETDLTRTTSAVKTLQQQSRFYNEIDVLEVNGRDFNVKRS